MTAKWKEIFVWMRIEEGVLKGKGRSFSAVREPSLSELHTWGARMEVRQQSLSEVQHYESHF